MHSILKEFKVINNHMNENKFGNPISLSTTFGTKKNSPCTLLLPIICLLKGP